jgi:glycogen debranching enzyme
MFSLPLAAQPADVHCGWRGPALVVVGNDGWTGAHPLSGFYFRQTRYLRELCLRVNDHALHPCSLAEVSPNTIEATYIFPEVERGDGGGTGSGGEMSSHGMFYRAIDVKLTFVVHPSSLDVLLEASNRWHASLDVTLDLSLSADFATIDEAQFDNAPALAVTRSHGECTTRFTAAREGQALETQIILEGAEWRATDNGVRATLELIRQQPRVLKLSVVALDRTDPISVPDAMRRERKLEEWSQRIVRLHAPGEPPIVELTTRAQQDLGAFALLDGEEDEWLTPAAGVPLYTALWGRDALTASWQAGLFDCGAMLSDVLSSLGRLQGTSFDAERDEQPGRIISQAKRDPLSRAGRTGFERAYQDVASPFMYLIGFGYHYALTGDKSHVARHWDTALKIVEWAFKHGDADGDGYIEYETKSARGPRHQGWKDSENAIVRADGSQVEPPIAACEIQGYWYVALQFMAALSVVMRERTRALELWGAAQELQERFNRDFWLEEEGFVALGLDANKEPIRALTSNAGQCLPTGIIARDHTPRLVRRMFEPDLFSGWGIRTLSTVNPAYHPLDYHLGSVWPVENASILFGLRRYGFNDQVQQLSRGLYDLARLWPGGRVPECVGGYGRNELAHPGAYPRANRPQAWNQSVWPLLVQSLLGIVPYAPLRLLIVDPLLPAWLPELIVRNLRVGNASVDLRFHRDEDGASHYDIIEKRGKLRIIRQPWLESLSATAFGRLADVAGSLLHH